ncbi:triphosphoribosyl-dephospho-CoA synthase [Spiroplasma corruscae]|uniref:triphosphoribosyl-dephospho-CoA synthase n=1 Tax=Spiroplasma corruscae TaxID=216934 RepID=A0A222EPC8_9MOLU|nr:triphosphoribosyl-dephospho-CoA synthase [Spiroplasma corruscae]ASP28336.1 triphosphoribosyl-dephospho-CoA synthase [Spiroplasma corruscae]
MKKVLNNALKSIKTEITFYPCLGLVSKKNSGSHNDMNYKTFLKSYKILKQYLKEINNKFNTIKNFENLKNIGLKYEIEMFKKTNNINTHKGLIFALGIFYYCYITYNKKYNNLKNYIKSFCKTLDNFDYKNINTYGSKLYLKYKVKSARHVACDGYSVVFDIYSFYKKKIKDLKLKHNYKLFFLLIKCCLEIDDTTLINKIGFNNYNKIKTKMNNILLLIDRDKFDKKFYLEIKEFNDYSIHRNISPGGAADILVLVLFLIKNKY